ncbi:MAG TPA: hypothetical protein VME63_02990 [Dyella sp.]|uniref:hypothetical protein n=1 Tax=Dyella sp. TaxID=1869338 RepID=UPI002B753AAD|nr:hypothetical protein [Dyella sp.]HTV84343.1 hypothetical protein [Dyella sp.]
MQSDRRHRPLLLMLCACMLSLLMNASMAAGARMYAKAWPGDTVQLSLPAGTSDAQAPDPHVACQPVPAGDTCDEDVTFADDEWVLPARHVLSLNYVPPAAPSSADVADLPASVALFLRPPDLA